jgi:hypothetical protein
VRGRTPGENRQQGAPEDAPQPFRVSYLHRHVSHLRDPSCARPHTHLVYPQGRQLATVHCKSRETFGAGVWCVFTRIVW